MTVLRRGRAARVLFSGVMGARRAAHIRGCRRERRAAAAVALRRGVRRAVRADVCEQRRLPTHAIRRGDARCRAPVGARAGRRPRRGEQLGRSAAPLLLEDLGLAQYFDFVITSLAVGEAKPNAAIFDAARTAAGNEPSRCVHIGDSFKRDVKGAMASGWEAVLVCSRERHDLDFSARGVPPGVTHAAVHVHGGSSAAPSLARIGIGCCARKVI